jgi:1,4-alpha-glucan branching enzyme
MLKTTTAKIGPKRKSVVKVTFALPSEVIDQPVSVLGDFNNWDPMAHPLKKRSNGTRSATVEVPAGSTFRFKYLAADGTWFCDPEADAVVHDEYQVVDSLLVV